MQDTFVDLFAPFLNIEKLNPDIKEDKKLSYLEMTSQVIDGYVTFAFLVQVFESFNSAIPLLLCQIQRRVFHCTLFGHFAHFVIDERLGYI